MNEAKPSTKNEHQDDPVVFSQQVESSNHSQVILIDIIPVPSQPIKADEAEEPALKISKTSKVWAFYTVSGLQGRRIVLCKKFLMNFNNLQSKITMFRPARSQGDLEDGSNSQATF